jgi:hypothetical protein
MLKKLDKLTLLVMVLVILYVPGVQQSLQSVQHKGGSYLHSAGQTISNGLHWLGK